MAEAATVSRERSRSPVREPSRARAPSAQPPAPSLVAARRVTPPAVQLNPRPLAGVRQVAAGPLTAGPGAPLPPQVASQIASSLRVDVSGIRVHDDARAAAAARAQHARAFTYGNNIFLGAGERPTDLRLMAHEVAHVVHQGRAPRVQLWTPFAGDSFESEARGASAAVLAGSQFTVSQRTAPTVQRWGLSDALEYFKDYVYLIPGYRLFTIVIGIDPLTMQNVDPSPANVLRALVELIPGGKQFTLALDKYGVFDKAGAFVVKQFSAVKTTGASIKKALDDFLGTLKWSDVLDLEAVWQRAKHIFADPAAKLLDFGLGLATGILDLIKDAVLKPLAGLVEGTRGWDLVCAILGKNPITGETVPQDAGTLIGGFMKLIGHEEVFENLKKAKAFDRAGVWFKGAMKTLLAFVAEFPTLVRNAVTSFKVDDVLDLPGAVKRVLGMFGDFIGRFTTWGMQAIWNLLEIIFDVVAPGAMPYIKKTGAAIKSIFQNPSPFMNNLINAAVTGFKNFGTNFLEHLKTGLLDWLTGALPDVYVPKAFSLGEVLKFILSVLGITWAQVRGKLVKVIGDTAMKALETGFDIVVTLVREGPAAAWDKIKEQLSGLKDQVISGVTDMVVTTIVQKAIPQIISMFIPGAGFVTAIIKIYDTIMVFVDKIAKIIQVVTAFLDSIVQIAAGNITAAAAKVESILSHLLSLAINFLAGFLGLGKVSEKIKTVLEKVRAAVDKAMDKLIEWIVATAKKLGKLLFGKDKDKDKPAKAAPEAEDGGEDFPTFAFTAEGHPHTLSFQGTDEVPTVGSRPRTVADFLQLVKADGQDVSSALAQLAAIAECVVALRKRPRSPEIKATLKQTRQKLRAAQTELGGILKYYFARIANDVTREKARFALEGLVGSYRSLQFPRDHMDADHQPQHKILEWALQEKVVGPDGKPTDIGLFAGRRLEQVVAGRSAEATAIVLGTPRHRAGRTHGANPTSRATLASARLSVNQLALSNSQSARDARVRILRRLRSEMEADVSAMLAVIRRDDVWDDIKLKDKDERAEVIEAIRKQVVTGEEEVRVQSLQSYTDLV